ncbi:hypothetical protein SAMN05192553_104257 [Cyclobacterium xiamenense]|uniref:Uncharacterized protein n=1 Tax=Cyclobacterium xiamenense TaxID=1297121 RepID=A0A1H6Z6M8_9BACT|nr:hypothetical protein SAMN05192553_104257 [Cyclobacterium xiamenense]
MRLLAPGRKAAGARGMLCNRFRQKMLPQIHTSMGYRRSKGRIYFNAYQRIDHYTVGVRTFHMSHWQSADTLKAW